MEEINFNPARKKYWEKAKFFPFTGEKIKRKKWIQEIKPHIIVDGVTKNAIFEILKVKLKSGSEEIISQLSYSDFDYSHTHYCPLCGNENKEGYYDDGNSFHREYPVIGYFEKNVVTYCPKCEEM